MSKHDTTHGDLLHSAEIIGFLDVYKLQMPVICIKSLIFNFFATLNTSECHEVFLLVALLEFIKIYHLKIHH